MIHFWFKKFLNSKIQHPEVITVILSCCSLLWLYWFKSYILKKVHRYAFFGAWRKNQPFFSLTCTMARGKNRRRTPLFERPKGVLRGTKVEKCIKQRKKFKISIFTLRWSRCDVLRCLEVTANSRLKTGLC